MFFAGDLIGTLDIDDPSAFGDLAKPFTGEFPLMGPPTPVPERAHQQFAEALKKAQLILAGYQHNVPEVRDVPETLVQALQVVVTSNEKKAQQ